MQAHTSSPSGLLTSTDDPLSECFLGRPRRFLQAVEDPPRSFDSVVLGAYSCSDAIRCVAISGICTTQVTLTYEEAIPQYQEAGLIIMAEWLRRLSLLSIHVHRN
jgi:hypothetical protein